ncbi:MAG: hypothetical protein WDN69_04200 [Aliidongia sp.]
MPALYLLAMAQPRFPAVWPVTAFEREYRAVAALPMVLILLAWFWLGALFSDGDAAPCPICRWSTAGAGPAAGVVRAAVLVPRALALLPWAARVPQSAGYWVLGPTALLLLTGTVLRTAHHWADVPFTPDGLLGSMLVQPACPCCGPRRRRPDDPRPCPGAAHRLDRRGGADRGRGGQAVPGRADQYRRLPRIISFIGVGVLC